MTGLREAEILRDDCGGEARRGGALGSALLPCGVALSLSRGSVQKTLLPTLLDSLVFQSLPYWDGVSTHR